MTTAAENQNWQKRQYDSYGHHFRIETANTELGVCGNIAYNLYGYSDSKDVSNVGMMGDGQFQIFADSSNKISQCFKSKSEIQQNFSDFIFCDFDHGLIAAHRSSVYQLKLSNIKDENFEFEPLPNGQLSQ